METVADAFRAHERLLWGLGYRMTGLASDADELVQETFLRALEHPVPDDGRPLRPWLLRVCANLARDRLRARRRRAGSAVWLPSPVPDDRLDLPGRAGAPGPAGPAGGTVHPYDPGPDPARHRDNTGAPDRTDPEARYGRAETAGLAFLLALEVLTPTQRAVLLLREVFDLDAEAVATALGSTPGAVRVAHHKARRALVAHDGAPRPAPADATLAALTGFLGALAAGDAPAALALLAPDVVLRSDGGYVFRAARMPVHGAEKVVRFLTHIVADPTNARWAVRSLNDAPMVVFELDTPGPGQAPRSVVGVTLDPSGRIVALHWVLDPGKLTAVGAV